MTEIAIRPYDYQIIQEPNVLIVLSYLKTGDPTMRLASIDWIKSDLQNTTVQQLLVTQPMSHDDAMACAELFAEKNEVPVIYEREDPGH